MPRTSSPSAAQQLPAEASLQPSSTVLLLVDFINPLRFPGADAMVGPALEAARATARLKRRLGRQGVTAVYANDNYGTWRSDFNELLRDCKALPGARGEIATLLEPDECDLTILKPMHSAFLSTPLEHLLRQMKTEELVVVGLAADMCVHLTAADAFMRGLKVWVPANCTASEREPYKAAALEHMSRVLKCSVRRA